MEISPTILTGVQSSLDILNWILDKFHNTKNEFKTKYGKCNRSINHQAKELILGAMLNIFQTGTKIVIKPHGCIQMYMYESVYVDDSERKINTVCMGISTNSSQSYHIIHHEMNINQPEPITSVYNTCFDRYNMYNMGIS